MKVLHTPVNYGSIPSHTVRCLRQAGVDAYGLIFTNAVMQTFDGLKVVSVDARKPSPKWLMGMARWTAEFSRAILVEKPDFIHWYFGKRALPFNLDLRLARDIPRLVEWQGSDIRNPDLESAENPYYKYAFEHGYEHQESAAISHQRQVRFAEAGFACAAPLGMLQYIERDLFPEVHVVSQRLILDDYTATYPDPETKIPLIVHSPTAPVTKGTAFVLKAIEELKPHYPFEFKLIQNMPRQQAMEWLQRADIYLDQFVLGERGMVALEAMAMGKPVVCYVKPSLAALYPPDMPIVNATQETLAETIAHLLTHPDERVEFGQRGRSYMEHHYAAPRLAAELIDLYQRISTKF